MPAGRTFPKPSESGGFGGKVSRGRSWPTALICSALWSRKRPSTRGCARSFGRVGKTNHIQRLSFRPAQAPRTCAPGRATSKALADQSVGRLASLAFPPKPPLSLGFGKVRPAGNHLDRLRLLARRDRGGAQGGGGGRGDCPRGGLSQSRVRAGALAGRRARAIMAEPL